MAKNKYPKKTKGGIGSSYMSFFAQRFNKNPKVVRLAEGMKHEREVERGSVLTDIPKITDPQIEEIDFYAVNEPFTYVRIIYNEAKS